MNTTIPRVSESFEVAVNLINPDHYVRALTVRISVSVMAVIVCNAPGV